MTQFGTGGTGGAGQPGQLTITDTQQKLFSTTAKWGVSAVDNYNLPATVALTSTATMVNNGDGTYTVNRPASGVGDATVYVVASKEGFPSVTGSFLVPQQDPITPDTSSLTIVSDIEDSTYRTVTFTFTGTAAYSKNGTGLGPATSPIAATRPSAGSPSDLYVLTITGADATTKSYSFTADVLPTSGTTASDLASVIALCNKIYTVEKSLGNMT